MRLEYRALWFEDDASYYQEAKEHIADWLDDQGFRFECTHVPDAIENEEQLAALGTDEDLDLLLVDLNLDRQTGDEVIKIARRVCKYTDIVFYSNDGAAKVRERAAAAKADGVYCAGRLTLTDDAIGVIKASIKKVLDLNHMRGLVMAETAQLDNLVDECLGAFIQIAPADDQKIIDSIAAKLLKDVRANAEMAAMLLSPGCALSAVLDSMWFTSQKRVTRLAKLIRGRTDLETQRDSLLEYLPLLDDRNVLAHAVEVESEAGTRLLKGWGNKNDTEYNAESLKAIRRGLIKTHEHLVELLSKLSA